VSGPGDEGNHQPYGEDERSQADFNAATHWVSIRHGSVSTSETVFRLKAPEQFSLSQNYQAGQQGFKQRPSIERDKITASVISKLP